MTRTSITPRPTHRRSRVALTVVLTIVGCGEASPSSPGVVDPVELRPANVDVRLVERAPVSFAALAVPMGVDRAFASVGAEGDALLVAGDGRFFAVDAYGALAPLSRLPGDTSTIDGAVTALLQRAPGEALVTGPSGGLRLHDGWVEGAGLPPLLARAVARCGWAGEALWATPEGVFTSQGTGWLRLDRDGMPVTDARALLAVGDGREAWVLGSGGALRRLRVDGSGEAPTVRWSDPVPGLRLDSVKSIAAHRGSRYIARQSDLVRVTAAGALERVRIPGMYAGPFAMVSAGPWLWMAWDGETEAAVARFDGDHTVEVLGRGGPWLAPALAVDPLRGDVAVVTDGAAATRVVVASAVTVVGLVDGETVLAPSVSVLAQPPSPSLVEGVDFSLDGVRVTSVAAAPYAWGPDGQARRNLDPLAFGPHEVTIAVRYRGAAPVRETRRFVYASPLGRVPTYVGDIQPLYARGCARCHSTGIARDLSTFAAMSAQSPLVVAAVRSRRMPPDLAIDEETIQVVAAWVAGGSVER